MSYMTGLMAGASLGQQLHKFLTARAANEPAENQAIKTPRLLFQIVHASAGRKRLRSSLLVGNQPLAAMLLEALKKSSIIQMVQINQQTGSLLLIYAPDKEAAVSALILHLKEHVFSRRPAPEPALAESGQQIQDTFGRINQWIRRKTCNLFDLQSLASLLFILRGVRKILRYGQMPSGPQMLWWAFSLLRGWRTA